MATEIPQWTKGEPITSSKTNSINNTLHSDIETTELNIKTTQLDLEKINERIIGNGVYEGLEIYKGEGLSINVQAGKALISGLWVEYFVSQNFEVPANSNLKVYLNDDGTGGLTSGEVPSGSLILANIITNNSKVLSVTDQRKILDSILKLRKDINKNDDSISIHSDNIINLENDIRDLKDDISEFQNLIIKEEGQELVKVAAGNTATIKIKHDIFSIPGYPIATTDEENVELKVLSSDSDEYSNDKFTIELINNNDIDKDIVISWYRKGIR